MTAPTVTATLVLQQWLNDQAITIARKNVTIPHEWLVRQDRRALQNSTNSADADWIVEELELKGGHDGPYELVFDAIPNSLDGNNTLHLWLKATEPAQPATHPAYDVLDQAANLLSSAGADDPGGNYVFGLPETVTANEDITLAAQLIRRAQDRLTAWTEGDLRALAADLIHRFGSGSAAQEGMDDDYIEAANAEFPDQPSIDPGQLDTVRDMMRRAVIEIDSTRYNDEETSTGDYLVKPADTLAKIEQIVNPAKADHQPERPLRHGRPLGPYGDAGPLL